MVPSVTLIDLPGSERLPVRGAEPAGPVDPESPAMVTVQLRRGSNPAPPTGIPKVGDPWPPERAPLSREEFAAAHGARQEDLAALRRFARTSGLRITWEDPARRAVGMAGSVRELAAAFGTELLRFESPSGSYRGRVGPLRIPPDLRGVVEGVFGLDDRPQSKPHFRPRPNRALGDPAYTPPQVAAAYRFPSDADGSGQCIGLIELGGGYRTADLSGYFASLGVQGPEIRAVEVDGATNSSTGDPNGPDGEVELDIEVAGSLAPGARIVVYFAPNTDQGFLDAVSTAVHDSANRPTIISVSWGGPEASWTAQARAAFESLFEDAATLGITVLVAAGDNGADDGGPAGGLSVDFPASSPGVIACGGTHLVLAGTTIVQETVWNELARGEGASGGGVSEAFGLPAYQDGAKVPKAPNGFAGRGLPDVAGNADPVTGYQVLVDGAPAVIGGTSAVAPLWAALIARLNQLLGKPLGYLNPRLYAITSGSGFHDITAGTNGGYSAGPGWDPCTGFGTPDAPTLLLALRGG